MDHLRSGPTSLPGHTEERFCFNVHRVLRTGPETRSPPLWRRASCHWAFTGLLPIAIGPGLRRYRLCEIHLDRIDLPRVLIPDVPGHSHRAEAGHEGIGIELLGRHDPDAAPATIGHQLGRDYRGNAGLVGCGLNSQFGVDLLVIGHIVDVEAAFLPVSDPARQRPDAGLPRILPARSPGWGNRATTTSRGETAVVSHPHLVGPGEAHLLQDPQGLPGHIIHAQLEVRHGQAGNEHRQGARLFVVNVVGVEDAELREIEGLETGESFLEVIGPIAPGNGSAEAFVDEDPRTEGGQESIVSLADGIVAVPYPQLGHRVEQVLRGVRGVDVTGSRISPHPQNCQTARGLELLVEGELVGSFGVPSMAAPPLAMSM